MFYSPVFLHYHSIRLHFSTEEDGVHPKWPSVNLGLYLQTTSRSIIFICSSTTETSLTIRSAAVEQKRQLSAALPAVELTDLFNTMSLTKVCIFSKLSCWSIWLILVKQNSQCLTREFQQNTVLFQEMVDPEVILFPVGGPTFTLFPVSFLLKMSSPPFAGVDIDSSRMIPNEMLKVSGSSSPDNTRFGTNSVCRAFHWSCGEKFGSTPFAAAISLSRSIVLLVPDSMTFRLANHSPHYTLITKAVPKSYPIIYHIGSTQLSAVSNTHPTVTLIYVYSTQTLIS